jgi:protein O-GlcNAc transferase
MLDRMASMLHELRLLLICARLATTGEDEAATRQMLDDGVDWRLFARKAIDHGLTWPAGHTLARIAPDMVPDEILGAFRANEDQTHQRNRALFEELARLIEALANNGIEATAIQGPLLAIQAYGDLGHGIVGNPQFLIRGTDLASTVATLRSLGYQRKEQLTGAQFELIHRLQGQEVIVNREAGIAIVVHTRLTPMNMALRLDYGGLRRRARRTTVNGRTMLTPTPEDHLLILAIHGAKELWWNIQSARDFAAFIFSHPKLDWIAVAERARSQGCLRMVLLATSLAREYFNAAVPDEITAVERAHDIIEPMVGRIKAHWQADEPIGPPSNKTVSMDRLRLHDGVVRQAFYVTRTMFLPGPHHVAAMPLPWGLNFAYVPIKIAHDILALPLWRAYRRGLAQARRWQNALAGTGFPLALTPASAEAKLGIKWQRQARAEAKRVLAANPSNFLAWLSLGDALHGLKRHKAAIAWYDKALMIAPDNSDIWRKRRAALRAIGEEPDLPDVAHDPQDANAWAVRAGGLVESQRFAEALEASDRALALDPGHVAAMRMGIHTRVITCDWHQREDDKRQITAGLNAGLYVINPFTYRGMCDSETESLTVARLSSTTGSVKALWCGERYRHDRIRVAYLSGRFHGHATMRLIVGVFEHHDKARFETTAISIGPNNGGEMRRRIEAAFDRFIDVQAMSDTEVAAMMREMEIDIAIDLCGHTGRTRLGILARRPVPVQVSYLVNPGTMGAPFVDYIIADRTVIPSESFCCYTEKVVHLPHSYQCNDSLRYVPQYTRSRIEAALPETGFVYCCFNNTYKIAPQIFDVWMRLLNACPGSVLWLLGDNPYAMHNLRREAAARGVKPERLIFTARIPEGDHLARHLLADLFLDTLPCNAHTTASDALWVGLPVLTCMGNTFAGRVAASLLRAVGLPELVTTSLAEYEELALALAQDPGRLAAIRTKLMHHRGTEPLFDTPRSTRDLETAYTMMRERTQRGEPPESFSVASAPHPHGAEMLNA